MQSRNEPAEELSFCDAKREALTAKIGSKLEIRLPRIFLLPTTQTSESTINCYFLEISLDVSIVLLDSGGGHNIGNPQPSILTNWSDSIEPWHWRAAPAIELASVTLDIDTANMPSPPASFFGDGFEMPGYNIRWVW